MVEQPPATEAPPAAAKVYDGVLDDHKIMQKELLAVRVLYDWLSRTYDSALITRSLSPTLPSPRLTSRLP